MPHLRYNSFELSIIIWDFYNTTIESDKENVELLVAEEGLEPPTPGL